MARRKYFDGLDPRNPYREVAVTEDQSDALTILSAIVLGSLGAALYFYV